MNSTENVRQWSAKDVGTWINSLGKALSAYAQKFEDYDIDGVQIIDEIDMELLEDLVEKRLDRKLMWKRIQRLRGLTKVCYLSTPILKKRNYVSTRQRARGRVCNNFLSFFFIITVNLLIDTLGKFFFFKFLELDSTLYYA